MTEVGPTTGERAGLPGSFRFDDGPESRPPTCAEVPGKAHPVRRSGAQRWWVWLAAGVPVVVGLGVAVVFVRRRRTPRTVGFVEVKRSIPRLGDSYGHWWVELDGAESYGWWPDRCPLRTRDLLFGTRGTLNGVGGTCRGGTVTRDPHHGEPSDYAFHPVLRVRKTDSQVRADIRRFAQTFEGGWRWSTRPTTNCRSFQHELLAAAGLTDGPEHRFSYGPGCPFLYPFRVTPLVAEDMWKWIRR